MHHGAQAFGTQRRQRAHIYLSAHRVAAVQHRLGASQHFDAFDVGHVEVVRVFIEIGNIVDRKTHHGLVHTRAESAHINRGRHSRSVIRHIEIRCDLAHAFHADVAPSGACLTPSTSSGRRLWARANVSGSEAHSVNTPPRAKTANKLFLIPFPIVRASGALFRR